jgi:hypothetical protein
VSPDPRREVITALREWLPPPVGFISATAIGELTEAAADALEQDEATIATQETHLQALQDKVDSYARSCACSYDASGDVCMTHSPVVAALLPVVRAVLEADHQYAILRMEPPSFIDRCIVALDALPPEVLALVEASQT